MDALKVLLIEDNDDHAALIQRLLRRSIGSKFNFTRENSLAAGLSRLEINSFDVILLDLRLPDSSAAETLPKTFVKAPDIPIIILTSTDDQEISAQLISQGAQDFLSKRHLDSDILCQVVRNSVQRKRLEEKLRIQAMELRESKDLLQQMVGAVKDYAIFMLNSEGIIIQWNDGAKRLCGFAAEEILGQPFALLFLRGDVQQAIPEELLQVARNLSLVKQEGYQLRKGGIPFLAERTVSIIRDEQGQPFGFTVVMRDLTEKRESELVRTRQAELIKSIVNYAVDAIITADGNSCIETWNPAAAQIFGYHIDEIKGQSTRVLFADNMSIEKLMFQHFNEKRQILGRRKNGQLFPMDLAFSTFSLGKDRFYTGIIRDVTEQKAMMESLQESEKRYRIVTEAASDAIFTFSGDGRILFANQAAEQLFGYPRAGIIQQRLEFLIPGALQSKGFDLLDLAQKDREFQGLHRNGHMFPIEVSFGELTSGGQRTFTGIVRDITERKKIEEAWRQAKEAAEAANQAKSLFLANMSHEIRTPLNSIMGFMELLLERTYDSEERGQFAGTIRRNAELLIQIVDDILDLSKVEAGKIDFERIPCSLSHIMSNLEHLLSHKAKEKGIYLNIRSEGSVPDEIVSDPTRLQQILINVIGNAIKFTSRGGVDVVLKGEMDRNSQEYQLFIQVHDTGRGIPPENIGHLFKPFSQADSSTTRKYGGTGLGLILSRRLAMALGGNVELLDSQMNRGSVFSISIKTHDVKGEFKTRESLEPAKTPRRLNKENARFWGLKVLIVDDSPDNQVLLSQILGQYGTHVTVADNGEEAIREALSKPFDLVFMDVQMPVKDGLSATRELRSQGYDVPILAVSAAAMKEDRERALNAGCTDHLTKPIHIHNLIDTIALHINKTK